MSFALNELFLKKKFEVHTLQTRFPHILQKIEGVWDDDEKFNAYYSELMLTDRNDRDGFPEQVFVELNNIYELRSSVFNPPLVGKSFEAADDNVVEFIIPAAEEVVEGFELVGVEDDYVVDLKPIVDDESELFNSEERKKDFLVIDSDKALFAFAREPEGSVFKMLGEILIERGLLDKDDLEYALERQQYDREVKGWRLGQILVSDGIITHDLLMAALCLQRFVPVFQLKDYKHTAGNLVLQEVELFNTDFLKEFNFYPVSVVVDTLCVAVSDPFDYSALDKLQEKTKFKVELCFSPQSEINYMISRDIALV